MAEIEASPRGSDVRLGAVKKRTSIDLKRLFFLVLGLVLFFSVYLSPPWPAAIDPADPDIPAPEAMGGLNFECAAEPNFSGRTTPCFCQFPESA